MDLGNRRHRERVLRLRARRLGGGDAIRAVWVPGRDTTNEGVDADADTSGWILTLLMPKAASAQFYSRKR